VGIDLELFCKEYCKIEDKEHRCPVSLNPIEEMEYCPLYEQPFLSVAKSKYVFEIYYSDLNEEARKQLDAITNKEHNYDVLPLATIYFEEEPD